MRKASSLGRKVIRTAQAVLVATSYEPVKEEKPDKPTRETEQGVNFWLSEFYKKGGESNVETGSCPNRV